MAKDVGAKKVIFASCAPPIRSARLYRFTYESLTSYRFSNVYGIDMPSPLELVAHERTVEEISDHIGADLVIYQTLEDLVESCRQFNPSIKSFDCSVFTGEYVTGGVDERYLEHLERLRSDKAQAKKRQSVVESVEMLSGSCNGPMSKCHSFSDPSNPEHTPPHLLPPLFPLAASLPKPGLFRLFLPRPVPCPTRTPPTQTSPTKTSSTHPSCPQICNPKRPFPNYFYRNPQPRFHPLRPIQPKPLISIVWLILRRRIGFFGRSAESLAQDWTGQRDGDSERYSGAT